MGEIIDVSIKNDLHSGAIERGVVVFSRVMFVPWDLDIGGVSWHGGNHPARAFFSSGSTSVSGLCLPPHLVAMRRPSGHGCFYLRSKRTNDRTLSLFWWCTCAYIQWKGHDGLLWVPPWEATAVTSKWGAGITPLITARVIIFTEKVYFKQWTYRSRAKQAPKSKSLSIVPWTMQFRSKSNLRVVWMAGIGKFCRGRTTAPCWAGPHNFFR